MPGDYLPAGEVMGEYSGNETPFGSAGIVLALLALIFIFGFIGYSVYMIATASVK